MKILHTQEFYHPFVGGSQVVVKQLSERMAALGHDVTVATSYMSDRKTKVINGVKIKEFKIKGNQVRGYEGETKTYQKFLVRSKFDIVMNYAAQQWATDLAFEVLDKIKAKKVLIPCGFSGLYDPIYENYFKNLPPFLKKYDASVYLSDNYRDINFACKHKLTNTHLIPNAADEREFQSLSEGSNQSFRKKYGLTKNEKLVLSVGSHTGVKGHQETINVFKKANIGKATLIIIGKGKDGCYSACTRNSNFYNLLNVFGNKRILILDLSRKETVRAFKAADVFLFLSNVECSPLVLFETVAAGTPFISSDAGNAKAIKSWIKAGKVVKTDHTQNGLLFSSVPHASKLLESMLKDPQKLKKIGQKGREIVLQKYTWGKMVSLYLNLYKTLTTNN
jgi:glycosyltransferase involved in cell wall biosynthesis